MSNLYKCFLLAVCAGVCLVGWVMSMQLPYLHQIWSLMQSSFILIVFGFGVLVCLVFGTPVLLLIEKWFSRMPLRYLIGGCVAAWIGWFFTGGPLFSDGVPWLSVDTWLPTRRNQLWSLLGMGLATGTLFTVVLAMIDYFKNRSEQ